VKTLEENQKQEDIISNRRLSTTIIPPLTERFTIELAVHLHPAVKSPCADVLHEVWNFGERSLLAVIRQVAVAKVLWRFGLACGVLG
jgi:hypothetical protein